MRVPPIPRQWHQDRLFQPTSPAINLGVWLELVDGSGHATAYWTLSDATAEDGLVASDGNHHLDVATPAQWTEYCAHGLTIARAALAPF